MARDESTDGDGKVLTALLWPFWPGGVSRLMGTLPVCIPSPTPVAAEKEFEGWKFVGEIWDCSEA